MAEIKEAEEILYEINKIHKSNYGKTLSNTFELYPQEFLCVIDQLIEHFPSVQSTYNKDNPFITVIIGY